MQFNYLFKRKYKNVTLGGREFFSLYIDELHGQGID
jgi:hypothetical protein